MSKIEILKFEDVLFACRKFVDDPENEENFKEVENIKPKLIVKSYLSMSQKQNLLHKVIKDMDLGDPAYDFSLCLETFLTMDVLLAYTNINPNIDVVFKTADVCDILEYSGILDYIRQSCGRDYDRMTHIVETEFSWQNIQEICQTFEAADGETIEGLTKAFENFTSKDNVEMLAKIEKIMEFNNSNSDNMESIAKEIIYNAIKNDIENSELSKDNIDNSENSKENSEITDTKEEK